MNAETQAGIVVACTAAVGAFCYLETPVLVWWAGVRERWTDARILVDNVAAGWVPPVAPGDQLVLVDHARCEGPDCDVILCYCPTDCECVGTVPKGCLHHSLLCPDCALVECLDCRLDAREDAGYRS